MTSYICTVKKENWEIILRKNIYFLNLHWENKMNNLKVGDKLIFYLMDGYSITSLYKVISIPKNDNNQVVVKIKPVKILTNFFNFKLLIEKLELIKKPKCWGTYIQVPLRKLSSKDEETLSKIFI